ncbi:MAG: 2'-5' RNA ligase family protein, partial [Fidelibacterota bacterium]
MISIWLIPAEGDSEYLQKIINDLASEYHAPVFSPHCTLYSLVDLEVKELVTILDKASEGMRPIYVTVDKLNYSPNIWKTVFIELELSKELEKLQSRVFSLLPNPKPYDFSPHISLIYKEMPFDQKQRIIRNLSVRNSYKMDKMIAMKTGPE